MLCCISTAKGGILDLIGTGLVYHGIRFSTLTIDESLSLRVGGEADDDGEVGILLAGYIESCYIQWALIGWR